MAQQVVHALAHLHANGMIHMDVKPANVVVKNGTYKLTDFRLASLVSDAPLPPPEEEGGADKGAPETKTKTKNGAAAAEPAVEEPKPDPEPRAMLSGFSIPYRSPEVAKLAVNLYANTTSSQEYTKHAGEMLVSARDTDIWAWAVTVLHMYEPLIAPKELDGEYAGEALEAYSGKDRSVAEWTPEMVNEFLKTFDAYPRGKLDGLKLLEADAAALAAVLSMPEERASKLRFAVHRKFESFPMPDELRALLLDCLADARLTRPADAVQLESEFKARKLDVLHQQAQRKVPPDVAAEVFQKFDADGSGAIDATELQAALDTAGCEDPDGDLVARMMDKCVE